MSGNRNPQHPKSGWTATAVRSFPKQDESSIIWKLATQRSHCDGNETVDLFIYTFIMIGWKKNS
jgi:hypothetical protein